MVVGKRGESGYEGGGGKVSVVVGKRVNMTGRRRRKGLSGCGEEG